MDMYAGLDVSLDETSVCIVDADGTICRETKVPSEPEAIRSALLDYADRLGRIGVEASALGIWLHRALTGTGLRMIVVEARHMRVSLSAMRNKTDRNDARGIAQMMRLGWFRAVHVKNAENQRRRTLLAKLIEHAEPVFEVMITTLLEVRRAVHQGYDRLHKILLQVVIHDPLCRRFMTVPGVGPVAARSPAGPSASRAPRRRASMSPSSPRSSRRCTSASPAWWWSAFPMPSSSRATTGPARSSISIRPITARRGITGAISSAAPTSSAWPRSSPGFPAASSSRSTTTPRSVASSAPSLRRASRPHTLYQEVHARRPRASC